MTQMKSFFDLVNELSMKSDKKLPNLKLPVKGKKGTSKFMRMKVHSQPYSSDYKKAMNAGFKTDANRKAAFAKMNDAVQSADRKPEKYIKPDGKVGIRMVKTDKEVIKKEQMQVFRVGHKTMSGNVHATDPDDAMRKLRKKGLKGDIKLTHRGSVKSMPKRRVPIRQETEAIDRDQMMRMHQQAAASQKKNQKKRDDKEKKSMAAKADMDMRARKESVDEAVKNLSGADQVKAALKIIRDKRFNMRSQIDKKTAIQKISKDLLKDPKVKKEMDKIYEENVEEALTLQQRMKRGRLMKRLKARIKIGRDRARRKMANKKTLEKRAMRQARNQIAKKLTRGIPKRELTFARKQEIEKRLEKPALKSRIQRIAKRIFKDVRKAEVQRKKG